MVTGGPDWLAKTPENTLEPDIPICDPHHHFWVSRPEPVHYQSYLLPELAADVNSGHNVRSTVFIEARSEYRQIGPEEMRPVGEVEFIETIASESATGSHGPTHAAAAIVGHADLKLGDAVRPVLEALQAASPDRFRGVRHSVGWDESPELANRDIRGALSTDGYRAGARVLADMGLLLENSLYFHQLSELAEFSRAVPESDHRREPHWRAGPGRPLRQPGRRSAPRMEERRGGSGPVSQHRYEIGRRWPTSLWLLLARPRNPHRIGRIGRGARSPHGALHPAVRTG